MKRIYNVLEGFFDADSVLDDFANNFDPELKWIKNNEIKNQVMQWCQPGGTTISCGDAARFFKSTKLTKEDLPKLIQALDILETMPTYITASAKNLMDTKREIEDAIRAVEFVNKYADIIKGVEEFANKHKDYDILFKIMMFDNPTIVVMVDIEEELQPEVISNMKKYQKKIAGNRKVEYYESPAAAQMYITI